MSRRPKNRPGEDIVRMENDNDEQETQKKSRRGYERVRRFY